MGSRERSRRQLLSLFVPLLIAFAAGFFVKSFVSGVNPSQNSSSAPAESQRLAQLQPLRPFGAEEDVLVTPRTFSEEEKRTRRAYQDEILRDTAKFRPGDQPWRDFRDKWITSRWLDLWLKLRDADEDLGERLFIPIHWWDCNQALSDEEKAAMQPYLDSLDTQYKYFTVMWMAKGLSRLQLHVPAGMDLLIFHAGGTSVGARNIPMPLLKAIMQPQGLEKKKLVNFIGSLRTHQVRRQMRELYIGDADFFFKWKLKDKSNYPRVLEESNFTLCPRGYGLSSYRMYEALQLGSIPILIWEYDKVVPYEELIDWNEMAIIIHGQQLADLKERMAAFDVPKAQRLIAERRHMFDYPYLLDYIRRRLQLERLQPVPIATFEDTISKLLPFSANGRRR